MDLVTRNLVEAFRKQQGFPDTMDESTLFEHFANFCAASKEYTDEFEVEDLHVAGGNDLQLDGVIIVVNGLLIESADEIDDLATSNKYIDAEFVFVQAKAQATFNGSDISNMFFGIRELVADKPTLPRNPALAEKESLIRHIYDKSALFKRGNPRVSMYYITLGQWKDDNKLLTRIQTEITTLDELNIFKPSPIFIPVDARRLQQLYNHALNTLTKTFTFANKVTLPAMAGVRESYLGFVSARDYLAIISDDQDNLLRGLFYENVRDFQGNNPVNDEIAQTLKTATKDAFVLLNNGVTIVAEEMTSTGDAFTLSGFQIVNGCQTSHVLYNNRELVTEGIFLPLKLVAAPETDLKNQIIKATNRQTVVKTEELSALTDFQKFLEQYYAATPEEHKLYYERRSQQFRSVPGIEKIRIITISSQIRAFASMFLDRAHQVSRYYGTLLKDIENAVFIEGQFPIAYYVSAYALFRLESFLRRRLIDNKYRPFKYHLLGILRMIVMGPNLQSMQANKFEKACEELRDVLWNDKRCLEAFAAACHLLDELIGNKPNRDKAKDSTLQTQARHKLSA